MNPRSLKAKLEQWAWSAPPDPVTEPRRTRAAARRIEATFTGIEPSRPAAYDLDAVHRRAREAWHGDGTLRTLNRSDLRRIPYVLLRPDDGLADTPGVVRDYAAWLRTRPAGRTLTALLTEYLSAYQPGRKGAMEVARTVEWFVRAERQPPGPAWSRRRRQAAQYALCDPKDGGRTLMTAVLTSREPVAQVLEAAGLTAGLARSGFLRHALKTELARWADAKQYSGETSDARATSRMLDLLTDGRELRFDDSAMRTAAADGILGRHARGNTSARVRKTILRFFLNHLGDPRMRRWRSNWDDCPKARRVMLRWLNDLNLELFFQVVKATAEDSHWRYREAFWKTVLRAEPDMEMEFVLGRKAAFTLREVDQDDVIGGSTSSLRGGYTSQSVLLMGIRGSTVAEWSHNGKCLFWKHGNTGAPKLYEASRHRAETLRERTNGMTDDAIPHFGSERGHWQARAAAWLAGEAGVDIDPEDRSYLRGL